MTQKWCAFKTDTGFKFGARAHDNHDSKPIISSDWINMLKVRHMSHNVPKLRLELVRTFSICPLGSHFQHVLLSLLAAATIP